MRKTLYILCIAAVAAFTACNSDEVEGYIPSPELIMIDGDGNISVSGSSTDAAKEMRIITNGRWTIEVAYDGEARDWLELSETGGTGERTVTLRPTAINPSASEPRTATLTIASVNTGLKQKVRVTQGGSVETLSLNSDVQTFDINGGRYVVSVTCNSAWTVTGEQDWCTVDKTEGVGNGQVSVTVAPSTQGSDRSTDLTFTSGERTAKITIRQTQYVNKFSLNHDNRLFAATGGKDVLEVTSDTEWTVISNSSWLNASVARGNGNGEVIVTAEKTNTTEARTGTLTFSYQKGGIQQTVVCTYMQEGGVVRFSVSPMATGNISAKGSEAMIHVNADEEWTLSSSHSWLTPSVTRGNGDSEVTVRIDENPDTTAREATITFTYTQYGKTVTAVCTFTQDAGKAPDNWGDNNTPGYSKRK